MPGQYQVGVKFAGQEIANSPFLVRIEGSPGDASKVTVRGPGIEKSGVVVNQQSSFDVLTKSERHFEFFFALFKIFLLKCLL